MVHQYVFEFKYKKVVFGKERELTHEVNVLDNNYQSACKKAIEHTKDHFEQWLDNDSSLKYVGEKIDGVLKPFVEAKEETDVKMKKKSYEVMEMENGFLGRYVEQLKKCVDGWIEMNSAKENEISRLEKRVKEFEAKESYKGGFTFVQGSRGSGKSKKYEDLLKAWIDSDDSNLINRAIEAIEKQQVQVFDIASMYPQAVDVCKVYQIERYQALKENEILKERIEYITKDSEKVYENLRFTDKENYNLKHQKDVMQKKINRLCYEKNQLENECKQYDKDFRDLSNEKQEHEMVVNGYKKELSQLNMLMDDMEDRLGRDQALKKIGLLNQKVTILRRAKNYRDETINKLVARIDELEKQTEKEQTIRQSMIKQMHNWKTEMKRKNKIIDALTEVEK